MSAGLEIAEEMLRDVDQAVADVAKELTALAYLVRGNEHVAYAADDIRETLDDLVTNLRRRVWLAQLEAARVTP